MNKNSNVYTMVYSAVMVIIVAVGLAFTSQSLKERQKTNEDIDKMEQILRSLNIQAKGSKAKEQYEAVVKEAFLVDADGERIAGTEGTTPTDPAFSTPLANIAKGGQYPLFVAEVDGAKKYIFPLYGAGLWGPIWGYCSVDADLNTIYGTDFSHASETPGLGAEITKPFFTERFKQKHLFVDGVFKSVAVVKEGTKVEGQESIDAISGSTMTSNGVNEMFRKSLGLYQKFMSKMQAESVQ